MEFFRSLLRAIGFYEPTKVDFVEDLPVEISQLVFRKLDPESILNAVQVSRKWKETCESDPVLRRRVRVYLEKEGPNVKRSNIRTTGLERKPVPAEQQIARHPRFVGLDTRKAFGNVAHGLTVSNIPKVRPRARTSKNGGPRMRSLRI